MNSYTPKGTRFQVWRDTRFCHPGASTGSRVAQLGVKNVARNGCGMLLLPSCPEMGMGNLLRLAFIACGTALAFALVLSGCISLPGIPASAPTATACPPDITGCCRIDAPGSYALSQDIGATGDGNCIDIYGGGSGATLDCRNHSITGKGPGSRRGS